MVYFLLIKVERMINNDPWNEFLAPLLSRNIATKMVVVITITVSTVDNDILPTREKFAFEVRNEFVAKVINGSVDVIHVAE